jgi:hypothetical protein
MSPTQEQNIWNAGVRQKNKRLSSIKKIYDFEV